MIKAGISTACFYPELTEKALELVCGMGAETTEIFINSHCELENNFLTEMKKTLDASGTSCVSLHPYTCGIEPMMFFTQYERRYSDILDYYKRYFEAMNILGAEYFVLHGNKPQNAFGEEDYFERFEGLFDLGKSFGVTVTQENVSRCVSGDLEFLVRMKKALKDKACFTLDVKQAVRYGCSPYDFVNKLGGSIKHIHISDHNDKTDCGLVGCGRLDFERFLEALKKEGFEGNIILELYRWGFDGPCELEENYRYIKSVIDKKG